MIQGGTSDSGICSFLDTGLSCADSFQKEVRSRKLLLIKTDMQSSGTQAEAQNLVLTKALQQHSLFLALSNNFSLNSRWRKTPLDTRLPTASRSAHTLPPASVRNEVSSAGLPMARLYTPRNHYCDLHLNSGDPRTCLSGLILTVTHGRDTPVNRFGSEVICGFHPESDFGGKEIA